MPDYHLPLHLDTYYHIFSRTNGNEKLFRQEDNYRYFLEKYNQHISPIADTTAWGLLPNHFHFLIRIKSQEDINAHYELKKRGKPLQAEVIPDFLMERFSNWLNSYTKAFNKMYQRKGSLFMDYMRRVAVTKDDQYGATIFYIHKNPVHHGLCKKIEDWQWSSYHGYLHEQPTTDASREALTWFGGLKGFIQYHQQPIDLKNAVVIE